MARGGRRGPQARRDGSRRATGAAAERLERFPRGDALPTDQERTPKKTKNEHRRRRSLASPPDSFGVRSLAEPPAVPDHPRRPGGRCSPGRTAQRKTSFTRPRPAPPGSRDGSAGPSRPGPRRPWTRRIREERLPGRSPPATEAAVPAVPDPALVVLVGPRARASPRGRRRATATRRSCPPTCCAASSAAARTTSTPAPTRSRCSNGSSRPGSAAD